MTDDYVPHIGQWQPVEGGCHPISGQRIGARRDITAEWQALEAVAKAAEALRGCIAGTYHGLPLPMNIKNNEHVDWPKLLADFDAALAKLGEVGGG